MKGDDNPKSKNYKVPATAPTGQSEEPVEVVASAEHTSTSPDIPPGPSTSSAIPPGPSTSAGPEIPYTQAHPITTHRLSQALLSINNWMQTASSKLSILTTTVEAQSVPPAPQVPQSIEDALKEILDNQRRSSILKLRSQRQSIHIARLSRSLLRSIRSCGRHGPPRSP